MPSPVEQTDPNYGNPTYQMDPASPAGGITANTYTDPSQIGNPAYRDPAMLTAMRTIGFNNAEAEAEIGRRMSLLRNQQAQMELAAPEQLRQGLQGVSDQFENSGMGRSSQRLKRQGEVQAGLAQQNFGQSQNITEQMGDASISLAKQIAMGRRQKAEQELESRMATGRYDASLGFG